uniref:39S ribosomal protein L18, mitochondrial n=1 Tax=Steinernema glaseri TaxID=37863 RepID=A0A1I8AF17_9BILA
MLYRKKSATLNYGAQNLLLIRRIVTLKCVECVKWMSRGGRKMHLTLLEMDRFSGRKFEATQWCPSFVKRMESEKVEYGRMLLRNTAEDYPVTMTFNAVCALSRKGCQWLYNWPHEVGEIRMVKKNTSKATKYNPVTGNWVITVREKSAAHNAPIDTFLEVNNEEWENVYKVFRNLSLWEGQDYLTTQKYLFEEHHMSKEVLFNDTLNKLVFP